MIKLSINLNKVALVRNSRRHHYPSVTRAADICLSAGANGITVHPRPDARHMLWQDVLDLKKVLQNYSGKELNIEGNPVPLFMEMVEKIRPEQVTLVPDVPGQITSDHGWNLPDDLAYLKSITQLLHTWGIRVSIFMDPEPDTMSLLAQTGNDCVELYTESYAVYYSHEMQNQILERFISCAKVAHDHHLRVHAGHDLSLMNLPKFVKNVPYVSEVSIGHAFVSDALEWGYLATTSKYLQICKSR
ncbi:MAG: pyridoxine 5'-phosphate synthase [Gammaproteobacteria bacterium]|nr:pyridoxine 5'-phosphate synthase [Gammaproteobacteria bacterium]